MRTKPRGEAMFSVRIVSVAHQIVESSFTEVFYSSNAVLTTPGKVTGGGSILQAGGPAGVAFGFVAQNTEQGMKDSGVVIDHATGTRIRIIDVTQLAVAGTHATFRGRAEVNGVEENYRIDVDDLGQPGSPVVNPDTFKIQTDGGYMRAGPLKGETSRSTRSRSRW